MKCTKKSILEKTHFPMTLTFFKEMPLLIASVFWVGFLTPFDTNGIGRKNLDVPLFVDATLVLNGERSCVLKRVQIQQPQFLCLPCIKSMSLAEESYVSTGSLRLSSNFLNGFRRTSVSHVCAHLCSLIVPFSLKDCFFLIILGAC